MTHPHHTSGYTLIELLVTVAIISVVSSVIFSLNGADARAIARLNAATRDVQSVISYAASLGNGGRSFPPESTQPTDYDRGYGVFATKNATNLAIYGGPGDGLEPTTVAEERHNGAGANIFEIAELPRGVTISEIDAIRADETVEHNNVTSGHILFRRATSTVVHTNSHTYVEGLSIELTAGSFSREVVVFDNGLVYAK